MAEMKVEKQQVLEEMTNEQLIEIAKNQAETLEKAKDTVSKMYNDIRMLQDERIFARLNYLFKVLDYKNYFSDKDNFIGDDKERETFVFDCVEEIYNLMKLPKKNE